MFMATEPSLRFASLRIFRRRWTLGEQGRASADQVAQLALGWIAVKLSRTSALLKRLLRLPEAILAWASGTATL